MEIFMRNIDFSVTHNRLTSELGKILHGSHYSSTPINFHVLLFRDKKGHHQHAGRGTLTLPSQQVGHKFLDEYGDNSAALRSFMIGGRRVKFTPSRNMARRDIVESINRLPYLNPAALEEKDRIERVFREEKVSVKTLQFGWECRDSIFSAEWAYSPQKCHIFFSDERRELRFRMSQADDTILAIAIRFSNLRTKSVHTSHSGEPVIFLTLETPPTFELEPLEDDEPRLRIRLSCLPLPEHARLVPYVSLALRCVCKSFKDLQTFLQLCKEAKIHYINDMECLVEQRHLFARHVEEELERRLRCLNWCIAFQIESLLRSLSVDMTEMLSLMPHIENLANAKGKRYTAEILAYFGQEAFKLWYDSNEEPESILACFLRVQRDSEVHPQSLTLQSTDPNLFKAYHIEVTPTTMRFSGPHLERSNRIIRRYHPDHHESFLRVSFVDEGRLHYRFDREVNGQDFIKKRVGPILLQGLSIAGREFKFLAYSQSALKEHAVWFVKPFRDSDHGYVDARNIIESIGSFDNLSFDKILMFCPARYGARISQAFTATDISVTIDPEEVLSVEDINTESGDYCFTDGVGTISRDLAIEVSQKLKSNRQRGRGRRGYARALQVRFQGSKGMLSVDHTLGGRAICLRPSMVKFEDTSLEIEVARAFDKPGPSFLNRPLIMLLENLGVRYEVFKDFQDRTVYEAEQSAQSLERAARLLEIYGLGSSFRLPSVMLTLTKLNVFDRLSNRFYRQMMNCAIYHVLRLLKNHARIPIPGAWTLVGVADVHKFLQEGEIFACIKPLEGPIIYLEGPVIISRSPTIHPGDVQIARAIGKPPKDSCFAQEPLYNTVVFSVLGSRPMPSCLGGGDLDGDVYNLIPLNQVPAFGDIKTRDPAQYAPAKKKLLDRRSTMKDVAEFVMEYINSDVVGIIAINWLIIADQSEQGIFDEKCMTLSGLHSDAVDYPKTGNPVAVNSIPKPPSSVKPDWNAPETVDLDSARYYRSRRAIGRLFRDITLPENPNPSRRPRRQRSSERTIDELTSAMDNNLSMTDDADEVVQTVRDWINDFIDTSQQLPTETIEQVKGLFQKYVSGLTSICNTYSLSYYRPLTEEEAVVGTIVQKTSQPRLRQDMTAKLREQTDILVRGIREELAGGDDEEPDEYLTRAWAAWKLSILKRSSFGGESFGWICIGAISDAIKGIEEITLEGLRRRFY
ncbi:hypothetical protein C0993_007024 [Termitomyces sp. T159_Od127]|nr:hypothetical protein C0993_007024 [Termitomyces sp. T159_Od127]